ncbi:unnamed protein product [Urochloa humidicola]
MERLVSPPPPPGAPSPTTLTPRSIPDSAATPLAAPANSATLVPDSTPSLPSGPGARSPRQAGRSKEERWSDNSPAAVASGELEAATPLKRSYRDAVLTSPKPAVPSKPSSLRAAKLPPRIVLRSTVHIPSPARRVRDKDGWETVESRLKRRERAVLSRRPRRPVPADLRGLCFNCFSSAHRAAQCKSQTRCFRCRALGHRSFICPSRELASAARPKRVTVWRRITPAGEPNSMESPQASASPGLAAPGAASDVPRVEESGALPPDSVRGGRRRRRPRHRRRRGPQGENVPTPNPPVAVVGNGQNASPTPPVTDEGIPPAHGPPCIIDWSAQFARAEANLRRAVLVTIVGNIVGIAIDDLKTVVVNSFVLNPDSVEFRRSSKDHVFIMFVEDEATITRITSAGPMPGPCNLHLHCQRWSRHAFAEGGTLPVLTEVELRGIPAHAREMSTAESLLSPYGWPHLLQSETRNREDYSVFRVSAWCFNPREIPRSHDLHIVEPPVGEILIPPGKPTLKYPVTIHAMDVPQPRAGSVDRFSSEGDEEDETDFQRRQRRREGSPRSHGGSAAAGVPGGPMFGDRLGPDASGVRHVARSVEANGSSSLETALEPPRIDAAANAFTTPVSEESEPILDVRNVHEDFSVASPKTILGPTAGNMDLLVDRAEVQTLKTIAQDQEIHEQETDMLPSMESPTLVCFALPNPVPATEHGDLPCAPASLEGLTPTTCIGEPTKTPCQPLLELKEAENLLENPTALCTSPPINWRPAEEVLPAELSSVPSLVVAHTAREPSKVYTRRPKTSVHQTTQQAEFPPGTPSGTPYTPTTTESFIDQVSKKLDNALPIPTAKPPRRRQALLSTEPPRRSRRIAKLPPENQNPAAASVCRELGFTDENSKVSAAMVEKYQDYFMLPLKRNDVKVMAAMLHKELPDELPVQLSGAIVAV